MSAGAVSRRGGDLWVFGAIALAVIGLVWLGGGSGPASRLDRAATGFAGMTDWLKHGGTDTIVFRGEGRLSPDDVGLRVLPLYDVDLLRDRVAPGTSADVIAQTSEVDMTREVFTAKIDLLPSLVILPKWRTGVRAIGAAHVDLLIPERAGNRLLGQIGLTGARILRDSAGLSALGYSLDGTVFETRLFHAQTVSGSDCTPILGTRRAMLLGRCDGPGTGAFHLLSDPDLMSNMGLALGQNADLARALVRDLAGGAPVVFDLSTDVHTYIASPRREMRQRSWDELARMFAYPFSVIWAVFLVLGLLVLWRAVTRYGPLVPVYEDEPGASKEVSIAAKARLLRLSNHDAPLMNSHITARLNTLAADLLGPHRPRGGNTLDQLTGLIARRAPDLAAELSAAAARIPEDTGPAGLSRRLDRFETVYDRIAHDFGRPSGAR